MTRDEAIARIKIHKSVHKMNEPRAIHISEALDMAIQALEQQSVLDKIRAEIMKLQTYKMFEGEDTVYVERDDALAIIDKYKAESEE